MACKHPRMTGGARRDYCPDCGYEFYYGDAHAPTEEARTSALVNPGDDDSPDTRRRTGREDDAE